jgi:hypothetical protein
MSEAGKVSLPGIDYTRLQSIKDKHLKRMDKEIFWNELEVKPGSVHGDRACLLGFIDHLSAALEEAQQHNEILRKNFMFSGSALAEAQQTIDLKQSSIEILTGQVVDETALHAKTAADCCCTEHCWADHSPATGGTDTLRRNGGLGRRLHGRPCPCSPRK